MSFGRGILSLIVLLNIPVSGCLGETQSVTCTPQTICTLRESTVNLVCSYSYTIKSQQSFWFSSKQKAKWRNEEDPEDLALDSDYAGRVRYKTTSYRYIFSSTLTITDLRESDSGEYHLMIITEAGRKYSSSTAVTLMVSDLQMTTTDTDKRTLNCSTSCSLTPKPTSYTWYENGQFNLVTSVHQSVLHTRADQSSSYSCSVSRHSEIRSNAVCVSGENCWNVLYSDRRVCALEGSSVDFPCTYSYPSGQTINEAFWYYFRPKVKLIDRVEFLGDKEKHCTLRMRNLTKSDSGKYHFRFITSTAEGFSGKPGVILDVTDLQVKMSPTAPSEGQAATLTCISTCTLPNNPSYIWYKNGQPVTNKPTRYNKLYLESASPEDVLQYSCALAGPEAKGLAVSTVLKFLTLGAAVFLVLFLIMGWMWRRRKKSSEDKDHRKPQESKQCDSAAVYSNLSDLAMTSYPTQIEESDDIHYSSVHFQCSQVQKEAPPTPASTLPPYVTEDQHVQYAAVNFSRNSAAH